MTAERGQYTQFGYRAAELALEQGVDPTAWTGDATLRWDRGTLVALGRYMYDQNLVYASMIDRTALNMLGQGGFTLQARALLDDGETPDTYTNDKIEQELWPEFCQPANCDIRGLNSFSDYETLAAQDMLNVGEFGAIKLRSGHLQGIESERINTPSQGVDGKRIEQGIELDPAGRPTHYWITKALSMDSLALGTLAAGEGKPYRAEDFIYLTTRPQRYSRTRPAPSLAQCMSCVWRLEDILDSEAIAWQLLARFAVGIQKEDAESELYTLSEDDDTVALDAAELASRVVETRNGLIVALAKGEKVTGIDRNLPGKDFPESVTMFLRLLGMRLGLPLEVLLLDWSKTNFSSGRAALNQATIMIRNWQVRQVQKWHKKIYRWKVAQWVADKRLKSRNVFTGNHEWYPPEIPWIDPKDESEAWGIKIDRGLVLYGDALKMQGKDRAEQNRQRKQEFLDAIALSQEIEKETGVVVPWQHFTGQLLGKTESAVVAAGDGQAPADPDEKESKQAVGWLRKLLGK